MSRIALIEDHKHLSALLRKTLADAGIAADLFEGMAVSYDGCCGLHELWLGIGANFTFMYEHQ
jgi:hypothetical protein